jgi:hypothetical protein
MRGPSWTPSIVPDDNDQTVYVVAVLGHRYERTDLEAVIQGLLRLGACPVSSGKGVLS